VVIVVGVYSLLAAIGLIVGKAVAANLTIGTYSAPVEIKTGESVELSSTNSDMVIVECLFIEPPQELHRTDTSCSLEVSGVTVATSYLELIRNQFESVSMSALVPAKGTIKIPSPAVPSDIKIFISKATVEVSVAEGPEGKEGKAGVEGKEGKAGTSIEWKNTYSPTSTYKLNQVVYYEGSSYIDIKETNLGHYPTEVESVWWEPVAIKGATGAEGHGVELTSFSAKSQETISEFKEQIEVMVWCIIGTILGVTVGFFVYRLISRREHQ
jgi:hypothetical protein